jgi:hypothetical protein
MRTAIFFVLAAMTVAAQPAQPALAVPDRANSTPWVAASGSFVAAVWSAAASGKSGDIFAAVSRDNGRSFAAPVRVNRIAGDARISGEIAPRVAMLAASGNSNPLITVTWNAKGESTQIKTARSRDGGRTFVEERMLQAAGAPGDRGWQASTLDASGRLHAIWLDHRAMATMKGGDHSAHKGEHDGVAMAQRSALYYASDGSAERELFKGVCYCCKTAMAIGPKGEIYAAWRHVFAGNMRDMAFTVSRDSGKTFAPLLRVNQDGWSIQGCPDDGPAMAVDVTGTVHLVWPTVRNEQGMLLYSTSTDGRSFTAPQQLKTLGGPKPSHPQIAIDRSGRVFVAWDEVREGVRRAAITRLGASSEPQVLGNTTSYPVMAATDAGLIAVWTSGTLAQSTIGVRVIQ